MALGSRMMWSSAGIALAFVAALIVSVCSYAAFYWALIPEPSFAANAFLFYRRTGAADSSLNNYSEAVADAVVDFSRHSFRQLMSSYHSYDVHVDFHVPESEHNYQLGNWMVSLELLHVPDPVQYTNVTYVATDEDSVRNYVRQYGRVMHKASKSMLLSPPSYWVRLINGWTRLPSVLLGFQSETRHLHMDMITGLYDSRYQPITHAILSIHGSVMDPHKIVNIYSTQVTLLASLSHMQYLMYHWFLPTSAAIIIIWTLVQFLVYTLFWMLYVWMWNADESPDQQAGPTSPTFGKFDSARSTYHSRLPRIEYSHAVDDVSSDAEESEGEESPRPRAFTSGEEDSDTWDLGATSATQTHTDPSPHSDANLTHDEPSPEKLQASPGGESERTHESAVTVPTTGEAKTRSTTPSTDSVVDDHLLMPSAERSPPERSSSLPTDSPTNTASPTSSSTDAHAPPPGPRRLSYSRMAMFERPGSSPDSSRPASSSTTATSSVPAHARHPSQSADPSSSSSRRAFNGHSSSSTSSDDDESGQHGLADLQPIITSAPSRYNPSSPTRLRRRGN